MTPIMTVSRELDIVLLGATGYTGFLCAEHITKTCPTTLKWAIAGRSPTSIEAVSERLKAISKDRKPPNVEIVHLNAIDLDRLASKTRVVINTIGPFSRFSGPIIEACAKNGTHYVDTTTETLWIKEMIDKYHSTAVRTGVKIIPSISLSSSPSDLLAWLSATEIKERTGSGTAEIIASGKLELSGMSGGSLASVIAVREKYGSSWFLSGDSSILSPNLKQRRTTTSCLTRIFGYRHAPGLGMLTTSFVSPGNESVVLRSAALDPSLYGPNFNYSEYLPASNIFAAILIHILTNIFNALLAFPLFRRILERLAPEPGSGPDLVKAGEEESAEFKAMGISEDGKVKVGSRWWWKGSGYEVSALLAVEAAGVLVGWSKEEKGSGNGGILTPSHLGMEFVERLRKVGVVIEFEVL